MTIQIGAFTSKRSLVFRDENDVNLNIPRDVDTFEPEPEVPMDEVAAEIAQLETELADIQQEMKAYLQELEL